MTAYLGLLVSWVKLRLHRAWLVATGVPSSELNYPMRPRLRRTWLP